MFHHHLKRITLLTTCGLAAIGLSNTPSFADPSAQHQYIAEDTIAYSKDTLKTYALAAIELRDISQRWRPRIASATTEEEAMDMENKANAEMVSAVETKGLSVEQFNSISAAARENPEINKEILDIIAKETPQ